MEARQHRGDYSSAEGNTAASVVAIFTCCGLDPVQ